MNKKFRVASIFMGKSRIPGACEIYRITQPFTYLQQSSAWETSWMYFEDLAARFNAFGVNAWLDMIWNTDIFVFPRTYLFGDESRRAYASLYSAIRLAGKRIVYEVDDDYTNEHRKVIDGDALTPAMWSDAITVTTPYLAETMRRRTKRPVHILPNCIDPSVWAEGNAPSRGDETKGKIIIGLTGSPTHLKDWEVMGSVLPRVLNENPNVHLVVAGFEPEYLKGLPNTAYFPPLPYATYAQVIRGCDIILCPVDPDDGFNLGKSELKAVEGMSARRFLDNGYPAGAAVIATSNPVYALAIKNGKTGLLVDHKPDSWYTAISDLITNPTLRRDLQLNGHNWVLKHRNIQSRSADWAKAYAKILKTPQNAVTLQ